MTVVSSICKIIYIYIFNISLFFRASFFFFAVKKCVCQVLNFLSSLLEHVFALTLDGILTRASIFIFNGPAVLFAQCYIGAGASSDCRVLQSAVIGT